MSDGLADLGLRAGEAVRFQRPDRSRWQPGVVRKRERDGSIRLVDGNGSIRTVPVDLIEVRREGPRGAKDWEPLVERADRAEQLDLLGP